MSGKKLDRFERQAVRVNRRYAKVIGDSVTIKYAIAAKQGRVLYQ